MSKGRLIATVLGAAIAGCLIRDMARNVYENYKRSIVLEAIKSGEVVRVSEIALKGIGKLNSGK